MAALPCGYDPRWPLRHKMCEDNQGLVSYISAAVIGPQHSVVPLNYPLTQPGLLGLCGASCPLHTLIGVCPQESLSHTKLLAAGVSGCISASAWPTGIWTKYWSLCIGPDGHLIKRTSPWRAYERETEKHGETETLAGTQERPVRSDQRELRELIWSCSQLEFECVLVDRHNRCRSAIFWWPRQSVSLCYTWLKLHSLLAQPLYFNLAKKQNHQ